MATIKSSAQFFSLPENLILEIFSYLSVKELCLSCCVCRTWRRIIGDKKLWRYVDLTPYKMNVHKMWKIIRAHFSDVLVSLKIACFLKPDAVNWKKLTITTAMMKELTTKCTNLSSLFLTYATVDIPLDCFPSSLQSLHIINSNIMDTQWFKPLSSSCLPNLVNLDLSESTKTSDTSVNDICKFKQLKKLNLSKCYRVSKECLTRIPYNLNHLVLINLSYTECTDTTVLNINENLQELKELYLEGCANLTEESCHLISLNSSGLTHVNLKHNEQFSESNLSKLLSLKKLVCLKIGPISISTKFLDQFAHCLPKCKLELN